MHPTQHTASAVAEDLYEELRLIAQRLFASERAGHTLQPTAVVNEACMRLMSGGLPELPREQQLALAGRVLKQVLIDHARGRDALKRGGSGGGGSEGEVGPASRAAVRIDLQPPAITDEPTLVDFDAIHSAIERLRRLSERQAEVVTLRVFAGMTMEQVAATVGVSKRAVEGDWAVARAWLRRALAPIAGVGGGGGQQ